MSVAVTQERLDAVLAWLKCLGSKGRPSPTNKQIALICLKMGKQQFQPVDRTLGIKWPKCEHGAIIIAKLEDLKLIEVVRGRNWRIITIVETGQILARRRPNTDGSSWRRQLRSHEVA